MRTNSRKRHLRNAQLGSNAWQQRAAQCARAINLTKYPFRDAKPFNQLKIPIMRARAVEIGRRDVGVFALSFPREEIPQ